MEGECNRQLGRLYLFQGVCQKETYFYQQESIKEWANLPKNNFRSRKKCEERGKLCKYSLKKTRFKFKALGSICKTTVILRKTLGIINFVEEKGFGRCFFFYFASTKTKSRIVSANTRY